MSKKPERAQRRDVLSDSTQEDLAALKRLSDSEHLVALDDLLSFRGSPDNVFRIVPRMVRSETMHSDMIAWLLDPNGTHRLGDGFACGFLRRALKSGSEASIQIRSVATEFPTSRGPVDILVQAVISGQPTVVAIENKIDASETDNQLVRYGEGLRSHVVFKAHDILVVFLTIDAHEPVFAHHECPPACVGYGTVRDALRDAIDAYREQDSGAFGFAFAQQYLEMMEAEIMKDTAIAKVCSDLLAAHPQGWRVLRRNLPSERDDILVSLAQHVCERFGRTFGGEWRYSLQKDRYARVWRADWETPFGTGVDSVIAGVEGAHWPFARTHMRLSVEPPDPDRRNQYFKYEIRLKLSRRGPTHLLHLVPSIADALKRIDVLAEQIRRDPGSSTITIAKNRRLPAMDVGTLTVLDWIMTTHVGDVVRAINRVLGDAVAGSA